MGFSHVLAVLFKGYLSLSYLFPIILYKIKISLAHGLLWTKLLYVLDEMAGAPDGTVLQNIYSAGIVSWLAESTEQIMNVYTCGINVYMFKLLFNK